METERLHSVREIIPHCRWICQARGLLGIGILCGGRRVGVGKQSRHGVREDPDTQGKNVSLDLRSKTRKGREIEGEDETSKHQKLRSGLTSQKGEDGEEQLAA